MPIEDDELENRFGSYFGKIYIENTNTPVFLNYELPSKNTVKEFQFSFDLEALDEVRILNIDTLKWEEVSKKPYENPTRYINSENFVRLMVFGNKVGEAPFPNISVKGGGE